MMKDLDSSQMAVGAGVEAVVGVEGALEEEVEGAMQAEVGVVAALGEERAEEDLEGPEAVDSPAVKLHYSQLSVSVQ